MVYRVAFYVVDSSTIMNLLF